MEVLICHLKWVSCHQKDEDTYIPRKYRYHQNDAVLYVIKKVEVLVFYQKRVLYVYKKVRVIVCYQKGISYVIKNVDFHIYVIKWGSNMGWKMLVLLYPQKEISNVIKGAGFLIFQQKRILHSIKKMQVLIYDVNVNTIKMMTVIMWRYSSVAVHEGLTKKLSSQI